jgi:hypothetical protein
MHFLSILFLIFSTMIGCSNSQESVVVPQNNEPVKVEAPVNADVNAAKGDHVHKDGHAHAHGDGDAPAVACACTKGKEGETVWCESCKVGYINKEKTEDKAAVDKALADKSSEK